MFLPLRLGSLVTIPCLDNSLGTVHSRKLCSGGKWKYKIKVEYQYFWLQRFQIVKLSKKKLKTIAALPLETEAVQIEEECPICFETLDTADELKLFCGHRFHTKCLIHWSKSDYGDGCPTCRNSLVSWIQLLNGDSCELLYYEIFSKVFTSNIPHTFKNTGIVSWWDETENHYWYVKEEKQQRLSSWDICELID